MTSAEVLWCSRCQQRIAELVHHRTTGAIMQRCGCGVVAMRKHWDCPIPKWDDRADDAFYGLNPHQAMPQEKISRQCRQCGKEYRTPKRRPSDFCAEKCRRRWHRATHREKANV